ncbi:lyase family protein [Labrenzia sp. DG1229]|uniref:lyase family protein n=1 Tax=Labrenzia sp. DG1229 TaxID=681847 RepID=UPI00048AD8B4|nr:lyase family protein [Labrenzia sp. DG1229]
MLDFPLYRGCYSSPEMRAVWSEDATIECWLKVEQTLARHQAAHGLIPASVATALAGLSLADIDRHQLREDMMLVGRPIVGLVRQLRESLGDAHGHVHYHATTQDIMDTALALQMRDGLRQISANLDSIVAGIDAHINDHGMQQMIGRTNGQHAVPLRLATKLEVWKSELGRRAICIEQAGQRGLNVQIGGPVGDNQAYENGTGRAIKSGIAEDLGLHVVEPHWQNARDGIADIVGAIGTLCGSLCKIAQNVNLLSSSDIAEFAENPSPGKGASSAMGHKRNQRASEFAEAVAKLGRQRAEQIGELTLHQHERSGGTWIGEWVVVPETFLLASGALSWTEKLFQSLSINKGAMERNLANAMQKVREQAH